ncbi:MAG: glycine betaine/L-proline ABC transporter substrate-binding protein ProX [Acidimicrobiia bacterium]
MALASSGCGSSSDDSASSTAGASTSTSSQDLPGKGKTVTQVYNSSIAESYWGDIVQMGLEKLGYEAEKPVILSGPASYLAVGNGDATFMADSWRPLQDPLFNKISDRAERLGTVISGAAQGYQIDKATADKYNIRFLEQLKDPELAKLFDFTGDGKADIVGCQPGWSCGDIVDHHIKAYGLEDTVSQVVVGDYFAAFADVMARQKAGKPVLYYTWTPNWTPAVLEPGKDVEWLQVHHGNCPDDPECDTRVGDLDTGWQINDNVVVANKKFLADNPVAKTLLETTDKLGFTLDDANQEYLVIKDRPGTTDKDVREDAAKWVDAHKEAVDAWVDAALKSQS